MNKEFLAKKAYVDKEIDRLDIKADNIQSTLNVSIQALQDADTQFTKDIASVRQTATMAKSKADANAEAINTKANTSDLATVATSGLYSDLKDKPTISTIDAEFSKTSTNGIANKTVTNKIDAMEDTISGLSTSLQGAYDALEDKTDKTTTDSISQTTNAAIKKLQDADTQFTKDIASVRQTATMAKSKADNALAATSTNATNINAHANDIAINRTTLGTQCKNLLKNETGNTAMSGLTFTHNSDGSVTINGTSDGQYFYTLMSKDFENILGKKCILTGCPANGSNSTFGIYIRTDINDYIYDSGAGVTFTTDSIIWISIVIRGGVTFNNVTFYPMIRYADITDNTYEPYKESVDERLIQNKSDIALNKSTLGYQCKNLHDTLSVNWYQPGKTSVASNGTVTATITSDTRNFTYANSEHYITLEAGNYIITVNTLEFVSGSAALIRGCNSDNQSLFALSLSSAGLHKTVFSLSKKTTIGIMYKLYSQTCTIMIRDADILGDTYEPYKESVDERLIQNKSDIAVNKTSLGVQCKNLFDWKNAVAVRTNSITYNKTESDILVTSTGTWSIVAYKLPTLKVGTNYVFSTVVSNFSAVSNAIIYIMISTSTSSSNIVRNVKINGNGNYTIEFTATSDTMYVLFIPNSSSTSYTNSFTASDIMLRYADITDNTYEPYQPSLQEQINQLSDTSNSGKLLYSMSEVVSSPLTVNITGLFTAYTAVVCNVVTSNGKHSLTLPLKYIKSLGTSAYYEADGILFYYVNDNKITISTGLGQNNPTINTVKIISLF